MKWCYCFLVLFLVFENIRPGTPALSKAAFQQTKKLMKNLCQRSSGAKQEIISQIKDGVFVNDDKFKCYLHCCLGMMKTMKKDKITVADAIKQAETLLPDDMKDASLRQLNACKDVGGKDACDIAYNFVQCCHDAEPNNILIPY